MQYIYNITIGLNDRITGVQEIPTSDARALIVQTLLDYHLSCSISEMTGIYTHENGMVVTEESLQMKIVSDEQINHLIYKVIYTLKDKLNQESVMLEREEKQVEFVC